MNVWELKIRKELVELDEKAEALGVTDIRDSILSALMDLSEPAGKESAQIAIKHIRERLDELKAPRSRTRLSSLPPASSEDYEDAIA